MKPLRPLARRVLPVLGAAVAASALLAGCSITTSDKPAVTPVNPLDPDPGGTGSPGPEGPDLQLRPVLTVTRAAAADCPSTAPETPPPAQPATLCSADLDYVLGLGAAIVDGHHVRSLDAGTLSGGPSVRVTLDVVGGTALSNATVRMARQPSPQNLLAIVSHGRVQSVPPVGDQIVGGVLDITGFSTVEDARAAAALFDR